MTVTGISALRLLRLLRLLRFLLFWLTVASPLCAGPWPQFHGPRSNGIADGIAPLPTDLGPEKNLAWKTTTPAGHSSPVVWGNRVFLTGARGETLLTIGLDATSGRVLWEAEAPHGDLDAIHPNKGSHAQSTPATDGKIVVSFFGASGLQCYDIDGKPLWRKPMGPFKNEFGAASSPIIVGDWVIINQDHDADSFLMALDKRTGDPIWKTDRSEFPRGFSTPVITGEGADREIIVAGTLRIAGYDFATGHEKWTVRGIARIVNTTPVIGDGGIIYLSVWTPGGDTGEERIKIAPWAEALARDDKNHNGVLDPNEPSDPAVKSRFDHFDRDKDEKITEAEYESYRRIFEDSHNVAMAIKPGGHGDVTETNVLWKYDRMLPYVPSPIFYGGCLFMVKTGGIFSSLDAATGKPIKQARLSGKGDYFASPVIGDGKIYLVSEDGELTVVSAEGQWNELCHASFSGPVYGTPAIADGRIYVRTNKGVYCFGLADQVR